MRWILVLLMVVLAVVVSSCDNTTSQRLDELEEKVEEAAGALAALKEQVQENKTLTDQAFDNNAKWAAEMHRELDELDRKLTGHLIGNVTPTARFSVKTSGLTLEVFTFINTSLDSDSGREDMTCHWDFGDGTTATSWNASHSYQDPGDYVVTLAVTDYYMVETQTSASVVVLNRPPQAYFDTHFPRVGYDGTPGSGYSSDQEFRFDDCSKDVDGDVVAWTWDFHDGTTSREQNPVHRFRDAGSYTVTLEVTDDDGGSSRKEIEDPIVVLRGCEACVAAINVVSESFLSGANNCDEIAEIKARRLVQRRAELRAENGIGFTSLQQIDALDQFGPKTMKGLLSCMRCTGCSY